MDYYKAGGGEEERDLDVSENGGRHGHQSCKTLSSPLTDLYTNTKQDIKEDIPEFTPMAKYVEDNWAPDGEEPEVPSEPVTNIALPLSCMKLVKATELLYHAMPPH